MKSILFLDAVLSTKIITIAYWIMLLVVIFFGVMISANSFTPTQHLGSEFNVLIGICTILFGSIIVRLWAEFMVVIFKIQQNTRRTADALERKNIL